MTTDPLLMTAEDRRLDLRVGDRVTFSGKKGTVVAECNDSTYPVKVKVDGEERPVLPIFHLLERAK